MYEVASEVGTSWSGSCAMCGGCCGGRSLDGDAIRARRPNNGDAVCLYSSVEAYESAYLGVLVVMVVGTGAVTGMTLRYSERLGGRGEISRRWRLAWRVLVVARGRRLGEGWRSCVVSHRREECSSSKVQQQ